MAVKVKQRNGKWWVFINHGKESYSMNRQHTYGMGRTNVDVFGGCANTAMVKNSTSLTV